MVTHFGAEGLEGNRVVRGQPENNREKTLDAFIEENADYGERLRSVLRTFVLEV